MTLAEYRSAPLAESLIDSLGAGEELDTLVAVHVFQFELLDHPNQELHPGERCWFGRCPHLVYASCCLPLRIEGGDYPGGDRPPYFSTRWLPALAVRRHVQGWHTLCRVEWSRLVGDSIGRRMKWERDWVGPDDIPLFMEPEDICRAALRVVLSRTERDGE